jgi:hypothetical protein
MECEKQYASTYVWLIISIWANGDNESGNIPVLYRCLMWRAL